MCTPIGKIRKYLSLGNVKTEKLMRVLILFPLFNTIKAKTVQSKCGKGGMDMLQCHDRNLYREAVEIIKQLYGSNAVFREGQYEAIEATMMHSRSLVVQKTGWGKSLVYFACTKLLRERGRGVTMVVSPLLVLMQNQLEAAEQMGLTCDSLNSSTKERRGNILDSLKRNELDLILVTPETLFRDDVQQSLPQINIGLFVIDEAHCISDWGHDFRLQYGDLKRVIARLPGNVPILATTATANDRVVADLQQQLGGDVYVSRGPLTRESLSIQVVPLESRNERYAWILQSITKLPGSGIIYCLTQRDCDYLAAFLRENGITAEAYYSRNGEEGDALNRDIEERFKNNQIKAIVATIKLGMGYDKGDIAFVIHFQMPQNIVSYYQQIGRAGRNIPRAYTFLMCGKEDQDILNYFIRTAFPTEEEMSQIMGHILKEDGISRYQLQSHLNIRSGRMDKALSFLCHDGFVIKEGTKYYATPKTYVYNKAHYDAISAVREAEMQQMKELLTTKECYSKFIARSLDDHSASDCGHCANCLGREIIPTEVAPYFLELATQFLERLIIPIEPRKQWATSSVTAKTKIKYINQVGFALAKYGDSGYGALVKENKYSKNKRFCDELVGKSARELGPLVREKRIDCICCVPSLRSDLVADFAKRLADTLGLPFRDLLVKQHAQQQKEMENSAHQCANAFCSFSVKEGTDVPQRILLVDDIVDSRWTLTVCGYRLMEQGCQEVYPFALADSSQHDGG